MSEKEGELGAKGFRREGSNAVRERVKGVLKGARGLLKNDSNLNE